MRRRQGELGVKQTRIKPELVGLGVVGLRPCLLPVRTNRVKRVGLRGRAHLVVETRSAPVVGWSLSDWIHSAYRGPVELLCSTRLESSASRIAHHCDPAAASTT
jgi:hypothetical protein